MKNCLTVLMLFGLASAVCAQDQAVQPVNPEAIELEQAQQMARLGGVRLSPVSAPLAIALPYHGLAQLVLSSDGKLHLEIPKADDNSTQLGQRGPGIRETLVFRLNPQGLNIVESDREIFLDRNGAETRVRGLSRNRIDVVPVAIGAPADDPEVVLRISGNATLSMDQTENRFSIMITDAVDGRIFKLAARLVWMESVELQTSDELVLNVAGEQEYASGCNACCGPQGQFCCSINCSGGCTAGCNGNTPFCQCRGTQME